MRTILADALEALPKLVLVEEGETQRAANFCLLCRRP
jgi:hypothetical protein